MRIYICALQDWLNPWLSIAAHTCSFTNDLSWKSPWLIQDQTLKLTLYEEQIQFSVWIEWRQELKLPYQLVGMGGNLNVCTWRTYHFWMFIKIHYFWNSSNKLITHWEQEKSNISNYRWILHNECLLFNSELSIQINHWDIT